MTKLGYILSAVALLAIGFGLGVYGASLVGSNAPVGGGLGGVLYTDQTFVGDVYSGQSNTKVLSGGNVVGPISSSNSMSVSGATTLTGVVNVSSASSTLQIGNTASGVGKGCLVLGNSSGATSTPVYITATGATVSATTTKPAYCK